MKSQVWKLWLVASVLGLLLVGTALGQPPPFNAPNRMVFWTEGGNPVLVAELNINFTLHDLYVFVEWAYDDGTTITDVWYFEQTLKANRTIPLYAPRRHANPWASVTGVQGWGWHDWSPGTGRCTYGKFTVTSRWDGSDRAVYGTVQNPGRIATGYVAFAALYDDNGRIIAAGWAEKEGVKANDTDNFTVGFAMWFQQVQGLTPRQVNSEQSRVFQGQWGWQYVGSIFPDESRLRPGLRNVCPSE
jgi:hypothetical protein